MENMKIFLRPTLLRLSKKYRPSLSFPSDFIGNPSYALNCDIWKYSLYGVNAKLDFLDNLLGEVCFDQQPIHCHISNFLWLNATNPAIETAEMAVQYGWARRNSFF
jgi:hypothetical protein